MTQINYPDLVRFSPLESLRLEILSPDNDPLADRTHVENLSRSVWGGFQKDFSVSVYDTNSTELIWRADAGVIHSPVDAWLSDEGQVVVISRNTFTSSVSVLNSKGKLLSNSPVSNQIVPEDEMRHTSAGPHWNRKGLGLCFQKAGRNWWSFRTCLGRQVLFDLASGKMTDPTDLIEVIKLHQSSWGQKVVENAVKQPNLLHGELESQTKWNVIEDIWKAVQICGEDNLSNSIPSLQILETAQIQNGYTSGWFTPRYERTRLVLVELVAIVKQSLRKLGASPQGLASYWLFGNLDVNDTNDAKVDDCRIPVPENVERDSRVRSLRRGMPVHELVQLLGMPDWMPRVFRYDISEAENPYTLLVKTDRADSVVVSFDQVEPVWLEKYPDTGSR